MRALLIATSLAALLTTACGESADKPAKDTAANATETAVASAPCADDGARLPLSGLCAGRAINYLDISEGGEAPLPDGCDWVVNETALPGPKEFLLYRAARCKGVTARLELEGGAKTASLVLAKSALVPDAQDSIIYATVVSAQDDAPHSGIMGLVTEDLGEAEAAKCSVRKANAKGWPADALVVDVSAAEAAKAPKGEPRAACGKFGLDDDNPYFWRVFGGMAWFIEPTQDMHQDIDPGSLTVVELSDDDSSDLPDKAS